MSGLADDKQDRLRVEDLIINYVKYLLRSFLQRDRHRARARMRLRTIDDLKAGFGSWLPFQGAISLSGCSS